ncbi:unnamed protein product [Rotaria sordida]|uniref:Uncharacterized protein n=1 Tax=Rotaria sordida TaxID=392033 RepID=A0A819XX80_9BILA|nr:unnamed protein product [Rotaria sordida]
MQRAYLHQKYNEGETSGAKWDAATVAQHMETAKENGKFIFEPDQFLTASQIKSYFSRVTRKRRTVARDSQIALHPADPSSYDEEDERSQQDEDDQDFDAATTSSEAFTLLNQAIDTLDDILANQASE